MNHRIVHIELSVWDHPRITCEQMKAEIEAAKLRHPFRDVYFDADLFALVSAEHKDQTSLDRFGLTLGVL